MKRKGLAPELHKIPEKNRFTVLITTIFFWDHTSVESNWSNKMKSRDIVTNRMLFTTMTSGHSI